jgi:tRNA(Ile)-lysidine synthase
VTRAAAEIEAAVRATGLLVHGRPVLVMYSGGRDSTCLLDLALRISGREVLGALHVNYGLREGSVLDERHCEDVCRRLDVGLIVERPAGPERSGNLQDWARRLRYDIAWAHSRVDIAAGHTASDQVETVLYRLISSPSHRAVLGMAPSEPPPRVLAPPGRAGGLADDSRLIRPLLEFTREETTAYCMERGLAFRDDPTNALDTYVRNRIRHELLPLVSELHPGAERNILRLAQVLRDEQEVLDDEVTRVMAARSSLPLSELRQLPRGLSRLVVQRLADAALGHPAAGVGRRSEDVLGMSDDARLDLPGTVRAVTERGYVRFERTPELRR